MAVVLLLAAVASPAAEGQGSDMGWSLIPGDPAPAALPTAGGVNSGGWPVSGGVGFNPGGAGSAFSHAIPSHGQNPSSNISMVPDANGLLPGQTKFYTPPPIVGQTVDASMNPLPNVPTNQISRPALVALAQAPANAFTAAGSNFGNAGVNVNFGGIGTNGKVVGAGTGNDSGGQLSGGGGYGGVSSGPAAGGPAGPGGGGGIGPGIGGGGGGGGVGGGAVGGGGLKGGGRAGF